MLLPAYRLRFFREQGAALRLAYGRTDLAPPRYDLALLAPQLLGVAVTEIAAGTRRRRGRRRRARPSCRRGCSGGAGLAVLVLSALIVRLLKKGT